MSAEQRLREQLAYVSHVESERDYDGHDAVGLYKSDARALLALVEAVTNAHGALDTAAGLLSGADVYAEQLDAIERALAAVRGE